MKRAIQKPVIFFVVICCFIFCGTVYAEKSALFQRGLNGFAGVIDTTLNDGQPEFNYGMTAVLSVGTDSGSNEHSALLRFDLTSIPYDSFVSSARLLIYLDGGDASELVIGVYRINEGGTVTKVFATGS